jgi:hypothetical protein
MASQDEDVVEEDEGETTIYFDAEEGTFVNAAGEEIRVDVEGEEEEELDDDEEDEDGEDDEGGVTPGATNTAAATAGAHTITSKSGLLRRRTRGTIADSRPPQSHNNTSCSCLARPDYEVSSHHLLAQADREHAHKGQGTTFHWVKMTEQKRKMMMESLYHSVAHSDEQDGHSPETAIPKSHPKKVKSS